MNNELTAYADPDTVIGQGLNLLGQQLVRAPSCAVDRVGWDLVLQPAH